MSFTWPGGVETVSPSPYVLPEIGDLNWFTTISGFLESLGNGAQCTTFQRYSVEVVDATPYTIGDASCVVANSVTARTVNLPAGSEKRVIHITNNTNSAITTTIHPFDAETIGGVAGDISITGAYESIGLIFTGTDWVIFQWSKP